MQESHRDHMIRDALTLMSHPESAHEGEPLVIHLVRTSPWAQEILSTSDGHLDIRSTRVANRLYSLGLIHPDGGVYRLTDLAHRALNNS